MELHDDPQAVVEKLVTQHTLVLGEAHGDLAARHVEVPDRFADQGSEVRPIATSYSVLETFLMSRRRRQTPDSTLKVKAGNGIGVLLLADDRRCDRIQESFSLPAVWMPNL